METQHTISEMTVNSQMSDVQYLFSKYEALQQKLERTEQMLREKEQESDFLEHKLDEVIKQKDTEYQHLLSEHKCLETSYDSAKDIIDTILSENNKITKAKIIETLAILSSSILAHKIKHLDYKTLMEEIEKGVVKYDSINS